MKVRAFFFWLHLTAGVLAGSVIAVMAFTGTALAFEKEIVGFFERGARRVEPAGTRLSLDDLLVRVRANAATAHPSAFTLYADPARSAALTVGRNERYFVNPYSGAIVSAPAVGVREFFRTMESWHRTLGLAGERRILGKTINDTCSFAFLFLALSGLYLWWPRGNFESGWKNASRFKFKLRGKARDWNWHNVIGFWSSPILIVLTATALPMSYKWAGDLIYTLTGSPQPPAGGSGPANLLGDAAPKRRDDAKLLNYQTLLIAAEQEIPRWTEITLRLSNPTRGEGGENRIRSEAAPAASRERTLETSHPSAGAGIDVSSEVMSRPHRSVGGRARQTEPIIFSVRATDAWPRTAITTLVYDPTSAALLKRENFADQNLGRRIRTWTRFLHTGEALGWPGQLLAGIVSFGALFLVFTGFSLAIRRFVGRP